jgi:transcriptional regulator with XRE-family HTH domain
VEIRRLNMIKNIGETIRQTRAAIPLTLSELAKKSGVSMSHLGRVERGERFPSGHVLKKIAGPLGFGEAELLILGGYLDQKPTAEHRNGNIDPYVALVLSQEPVKVQRAVVSILAILKVLAGAGESRPE